MSVGVDTCCYVAVYGSCKYRIQECVNFTASALDLD